MRFDKFIEEVNSIKNPPDKKVFLSILIDRKMANIEKAYTDKSLKYLANLRVDMKSKDLPLIAKSLALLAKDQSRLLMILDKLVEDRKD